MVVLDVTFHAIASVVFVITEFTFQEALCAVSSLNVSHQFGLVCQNFVTLFTLNFLAFFVDSPFLFCHSTELLMSLNCFGFNSTGGVGNQLLFTMFVFHVILQAKHRIEAYMGLDLQLCVRQNMFLQDVYSVKCL